LHATERSPQHLAYQTTSVRFSFSAPSFDDRMNIQYSYLLEGISEDWSAWQDVPFQEYTGLRPGRYVFRVKARSLLGEKANEAAYHFQLTPIWYKTDLAYMGYALASFLLIIFAARQIQQRIEHVKQKTIAEEEKKRKVLQLEIERIKLEREKEEIIKDKEILEEDVIFKSKELANYTMLLVKKHELLSEMSEDLKNLKDAVSNDRARQAVRELQRKITQNLQSEEHLKVFEANFERVHSEFFSQLRSSFPDLTQKELQLCAFVKMNLTNKEIASILNLSVRGVETARYRLRKRLGISHEEDMADFLEKLYDARSEAPEMMD
jgi:DNA-binding CsgD family transcriptional regulator